MKEDRRRGSKQATQSLLHELLSAHTALSSQPCEGSLGSIPSSIHSVSQSINKQ